MLKAKHGRHGRTETSSKRYCALGASNISSTNSAQRPPPTPAAPKQLHGSSSFPSPTTLTASHQKSPNQTILKKPARKQKKRALSRPVPSFSFSSLHLPLALHDSLAGQVSLEENKAGTQVRVAGQCQRRNRQSLLLLLLLLDRVAGETF